MKDNIHLDDDDIDWKEELKNTTLNLLFSKPPTYSFINPELGLNINPDSFIEWLGETGEENYGETYAEKVASMCEYSCLYLAMKFSLEKPEGDMRLVCGNFGFWEHWWVEYTLKDKVYIIDLTLKQFVADAPELSITEASYDKKGYRKGEHCDYSYSLEDYCNDKHAFRFFPIPKKRLGISK